jgi:regulation of enolase protein 1 (concanavalin A-like superfamily)
LRAARGAAAMDERATRIKSDWATTDTPGDAPYFAIRLSRSIAKAFSRLGWALSDAAAAGIRDAWLGVVLIPMVAAPMCRA